MELGADLTRLAKTTAGLGARLSRNAFRAHIDGGEERFVTQRCYGVTLPEASARLTRLLEVVGDEGFAILDVEEEYVVWDSGVSLDAGWLDEV